LLNRMSPPGAKLFCTTNADSPYHYIYKDFIKNEDLTKKGLIETINFDLEDNPHLTKEFKDALRSYHKGVFYQRFILGNWVLAEGIIYRDCWNDKYIYKTSDLPVWFYGTPHETYIGVDYGTANPCVFLKIIDDGRTFWVEKEYYWDSIKEAKQKTDSEYANDLEKFVSLSEAPWLVLDPSAESFQVEIQSRGHFLVNEAENNVLYGIRLTATMMAKGLIRIHESCKNFLEEIATYAWDEKSAEKTGKEAPIKEHDHTMDALRYVVETKISSIRLQG